MDNAQTENATKAWKWLCDSDFTIGESMFIRSSFASMNKDEWPFINVGHEKGKIKGYRSNYEAISNLMFSTEKEVCLANAMYRMVSDDFNINEFIQQIKFTHRILNSETEWSK